MTGEGEGASSILELSPEKPSPRLFQFGTYPEYYLPFFLYTFG